jgi:hypothetical protein
LCCFGNLKEGDNWDDTGMDGDIKLDTEDIRWGSMDWITLAEERDRLWALVNMVMNHQVP